MMDNPGQTIGQQEKKPKPDSVHIKSVHPVVAPSPMGGLLQILWGLGDDDKMYQWDSKQEKWLLS